MAQLTPIMSPPAAAARHRPPAAPTARPHRRPGAEAGAAGVRDRRRARPGRHRPAGERTTTATARRVGPGLHPDRRRAAQPGRRRDRRRLARRSSGPPRQLVATCAVRPRIFSPPAAACRRGSSGRGRCVGIARRAAGERTGLARRWARPGRAAGAAGPRWRASAAGATGPGGATPAGRARCRRGVGTASQPPSAGGRRAARVGEVRGPATPRPRPGPGTGRAWGRRRAPGPRPTPVGRKGLAGRRGRAAAAGPRRAASPEGGPERRAGRAEPPEPPGSAAGRGVRRGPGRVDRRGGPVVAGSPPPSTRAGLVRVAAPGSRRGRRRRRRAAGIGGAATGAVPGRRRDGMWRVRARKARLLSRAACPDVQPRLEDHRSSDLVHHPATPAPAHAPRPAGCVRPRRWTAARPRSRPATSRPDAQFLDLVEDASAAGPTDPSSDSGRPTTTTPRPPPRRRASAMRRWSRARSPERCTHLVRGGQRAGAVGQGDADAPRRRGRGRRRPHHGSGDAGGGAGLVEGLVEAGRVAAAGHGQVGAPCRRRPRWSGPRRRSSSPASRPPSLRDRGHQRHAAALGLRRRATTARMPGWSRTASARSRSSSRVDAVDPGDDHAVDRAGGQRRRPGCRRPGGAAP